MSQHNTIDMLWLGPPPSPPPPQFITRETAKPATTTTTNEKLSHLSLSLSNTLLTQASLRFSTDCNLQIQRRHVTQI
ncbi:hypothetical protein P8452_51536 [Trifolium repens]|nr:hypothetical protein P8452_51536 [Trifolium repens]